MINQDLSISLVGLSEEQDESALVIKFEAPNSEDEADKQALKEEVEKTPEESVKESYENDDLAIDDKEITEMLRRKKLKEQTETSLRELVVQDDSNASFMKQQAMAAGKQVTFENTLLDFENTAQDDEFIDDLKVLEDMVKPIP